MHSPLFWCFLLLCSRLEGRPLISTNLIGEDAFDHPTFPDFLREPGKILFQLITDSSGRPYSIEAVQYDYNRAPVAADLSRLYVQRHSTLFPRAGSLFSREQQVEFDAANPAPSPLLGNAVARYYEPSIGLKYLAVGKGYRSGLGFSRITYLDLRTKVRFEYEANSATGIYERTTTMTDFITAAYTNDFLGEGKYAHPPMFRPTERLLTLMAEDYILRVQQLNDEFVQAPIPEAGAAGIDTFATGGEASLTRTLGAGQSTLQKPVGRDAETSTNQRFTFDPTIE